MLPNAPRIGITRETAHRTRSDSGIQVPRLVKRVDVHERNVTVKGKNVGVGAPKVDLLASRLLHRHIIAKHQSPGKGLRRRLLQLL